jgi:type I restriction enzyme S subunit
VIGMEKIDTVLIDHLDLWTSAIARRSSAGRGRSKKFSLHGIDKLRALVFELAAKGKLIVGADLDPKPLGAHVELIMGQAPPGDECNKTGHGTVFVKTGEFGELYPEICEWTTKPLKLAQSGDVLICVVGATIGKLNLAIDCAIGRSVAAIRPDPCLETKFLYYSLMPYTMRLRSGSRGSAQGVIGKSELNAVKIRVPNIAEQRRIVAKVDELMALCDRLEAETYEAIETHQLLVTELLATLTASRDAGELAENWARIETHFDTLFVTEDSVDQLKQTILQLAVMGRLVPQDPNDEPAVELLKKIKVEKAKLVSQRKIKKPKLLPSIEDDKKPFALPRGWLWARFPEVGIFERGKSKHRPRNAPKLFNPGLYPLVQTGEVARANEIINEFHSEYSEEGLEQSKMWPKGTMCITIAANIADSAILGFDACFPDSVVGFIPFEPISGPRYFLHFMKTAKADLLRFAPSTAQKNINLSILESVLVPIPPLKEMERIVGKIDELSSFCNLLKTRIRESGETSLTLADAIVAKAVG